MDVDVDVSCWLLLSVDDNAIVEFTFDIDVPADVVYNGIADVAWLISFSVSLISVYMVVSSDSSNNVTLSVVNGISSVSSINVVGKTVVVVVIIIGFFVDGFVGNASIVLGFVIGFFVIFVDVCVVGFRVGKRVVSVKIVVWDVVEDNGITLGIKIHSGGCSVFTIKKIPPKSISIFFFLVLSN